MEQVTNIVTNAKQAPWRIQRQWIGLFLLGFVAIAMVAGIYLNVTARTAVSGREIQNLQTGISANLRTNSDLETQLASLTSAQAMQRRALALGFEPVRPEDITYVVVPGYVPDRTVDLSNPQAEQTVRPILLPEYSESLFDWFTRTLAADLPAGGQ
jgi:cell division protein FtsL